MENNILVNVPGVDSHYFHKPLGRQLADIQAIKAFKDTAKTYHIGTKHHASLSKVKQWLKENKPSAWYASWRKGEAEGQEGKESG